MKPLLIFMICICFFSACKAQKDMESTRTKIELITDKGIQYTFPENIEEALNKVISENEEKSYLMKLKTINDSTHIGALYYLSNSKDGLMQTSMLIKKTGRYYLYKAKRIPIIFATDYMFSSPGFVITHSCYRITFRFKNDKGTILQEDR